jgi:hypothetical protein
MSILNFIKSDFFSLPGLEPDSMDAEVMLATYNNIYNNPSSASDEMSYVFLFPILIALCLILVMMVYGLRILFTPVRIPQKKNNI